MPALSPTMEEGSIVRWLVKVGETVDIGDALCEVETDKAVVTVEASEEGTVAQILQKEGTKNIKLATPIAVIAEEGEDFDAALNYKVGDAAVPQQQQQQQQQVASTPAVQQPPEPATTAPDTTSQPSKDLALSPAVRQAIEWYKIDPSQLRASGRKGRILKGDVLKFIAERGLKQHDLSASVASPQHQQAPVVPTTAVPAAAPPPPPPKQQASPASPPLPAARPGGRKAKYEDLEVSNVRKVIAQRLTESKQRIPHSYNSITCRVDEIVKLRAELKKNGTKLSMNDFVVKAAGVALQQNKLVNSVWKGEEAQECHTSDISIAVATDGGLITPIIKTVETKGLEQISKETRSLAVKARDGKLKPEEFQGGSFTISNLGMFGVKEFTAVINPPQTCILAVGATKPAIITSEEQADPERVSLMRVTLSSDARVVNDAEASTFLESFKRKIENPIEMFM